MILVSFHENHIKNHLNMSKHVGENCGQLCISNTLSSKGV